RLRCLEGQRSRNRKRHLADEQTTNLGHSLIEPPACLCARVFNLKCLMKITSQAFNNGATIPDKYSKYGENRIPPLHFENVPPKARSLALIVDDPDAPRGTFN